MRGGSDEGDGMKRLKRFIRVVGNVASVASLVLCAVAVALWVAGRGEPCEVVRSGPGREDTAGVSRGEAYWFHSTLAAAAGTGPVEWSWSHDDSGVGGRDLMDVAATFDNEGGLWVGRFYFGRSRRSPNGPTLVMAPMWFVVGVLAVAPAGVVGRRVFGRRRRAGDGRCAVCGYDLRATPERCPECGAAVAKVEA